MSSAMQVLCNILHIKQLQTTMYHPQMDRLDERLNRIVKRMIRTTIQGDPCNWDQVLVPLLFTVRETTQASTGFSSFKLIYGDQPWGLLHVVREGWEKQASGVTTVPNYVIRLQERIHTAHQLAQDNLCKAQDRQRDYGLYQWCYYIFEPLAATSRRLMSYIWWTESGWTHCQSS